MLGYQIKNIIMNEGDQVAPLADKVTTESRVNVTQAVNDAKTAVVQTEQPAYSYTNGDRELASALAGGCGSVAKMYKDFNNHGGGGGAGPGGLSTWYVIVVLGLLSLPFFIVHSLRMRRPESRRKHQRYMIDTDVKVKVGGRELVGNISSISQGGVQINTDELLENGGIVTMKIASPDGQGQVEIQGRVVWSEAKRSYGVQFDQAEESVLQRIGNWTRSLTKIS